MSFAQSAVKVVHLIFVFVLDLDLGGSRSLIHSLFPYAELNR